MADEYLVHKVRELGDIGLAALLCLISREHCITSTDPEYLDDLTTELELIATRTFDLTCAVVDCTPETTLNDFVTAIQIPPPQTKPTTPRTPSPLHARGPEQHSYVSASRGRDAGSANTITSAQLQSHAQTQRPHGTLRPMPSLTLNPTSRSRTSSPSIGPQQQQQQQQIANVVLARDLDRAPKAVQIQCLELMRTRRIFTRTAVQTCPKQFLFVAVLGAESAGQARLTKHLNDHFYISHWHDPYDGFAHVEEAAEEEEEGEGRERSQDNTGGDSDAASIASSASVVRRPRTPKSPSTPTHTTSLAPSPGQIATTDWAILQQRNRAEKTTDDNTAHKSQSQSQSQSSDVLFTETDISTLSTLTLQTDVDVEVERYQMNIISFLRLHRAVMPGSVPPSATTHFRTLVRSLAALHGLDFATPEMVQLAARKIYAHHVAIVPPHHERSMQWGSDLNAVTALLEGVQPEDVVEEVLSIVDAPL